MLPGQAVQLDHADNGDPRAYVGYSHQRCNASAGAAHGNAMRAAAYRAAKGLPEPPASAQPAAVPVRCKRPADASAEERMRCICGRLTSRCW
jgi:hypothetical protein